MPKGKYPCRVGCGRPPLMNPGARDSHEAACALKQGTIPNVETLEEKLMASECTDCKLKDRDIKDLGEKLDAAQGQVQDQTAQLAQKSQEHPRMDGMLVHAAGGSCPTCADDLERHSEALIEKAISGLSDPAIRQIATDRGLFPASIRVTVPSE